VICLTKADLADPDELVQAYAPLDVPMLVTQRGGEMLRSMFAIHFVFNIFANTLYAVGFLCTSQPLKSR